jgi:predicted transcriptional regulator
MTTHIEVRTEMTRRKTQRQRLLEAFREKGALTTREVIRLTGSGVSSRIHELREDGFKIVAVRETEYSYRYVFTDKLPTHWKAHKLRNREAL